VKKLIVVVCLGLFFLCVCFLKPENKRDFYFSGGIKHTGGGYETASTYVVVNNKSYGLEELLEKIRSEYILMNGEPDELTIYLYDSEYSLNHFEAYYSITYKKE
jgi:hypothetical protein